MPIEGLRTPVGRVVWGNPKKSQIKKDQRTKQPILKDGKPVEQWAFGVAFTKPEFNQFMKPYSIVTGKQTFDWHVLLLR